MPQAWFRPMTSRASRRTWVGVAWAGAARRRVRANAASVAVAMLDRLHGLACIVELGLAGGAFDVSLTSYPPFTADFLPLYLL